MEVALKYKNNSKSDIETFDAICNALTYPNLNSGISVIKQNFTAPYISFIENLLENHPSNIIEEIEVLNKELKELINTENMEVKEQEVISTICNDIDNLKSDYEDKGNNAFIDFIKKLTANKKLYIVKNKKGVKIITEILNKIKKINEVYTDISIFITNGLDALKQIGILND